MHKIADSHIHIRFCKDEDIIKMLDDMASVGVTATCILPLPYRGAAENLAALYHKLTYKKMDVRAFGALHTSDRYAALPPEVQAEALLDLGCDGFKIMNCPEHRKFFEHGINDKRYEKMFALFEERRTPVTIHVSDPEEWWRPWTPGSNFSAEGYPTRQQMYDEMFEVLDKHPKLKVSFAHFFFLSNCPFEAERVMEKYPNVYFDLTPGTGMYYNFDNNLDFWRNFFTKYSHRILFGTDCNAVKAYTNKELVLLVYRKLTESTDYFTQICYDMKMTVRGLELSDQVVERICYKNFFEFVGKKKAVNTEKFYEYCERIIHDIETCPHDPYYIKGSEIVPHLKEDPCQNIAVDFCKKRLAYRNKINSPDNTDSVLHC